MLEMVPHTLAKGRGAPSLGLSLTERKRETGWRWAKGHCTSPGKATGRQGCAQMGIPSSHCTAPLSPGCCSLGSGGTKGRKGHAQASGSPDFSSGTTTHFTEFILWIPDPGHIQKGLPQQLGWHLLRWQRFCVAFIPRCTFWK